MGRRERAQDPLHFTSTATKRTLPLVQDRTLTDYLLLAGWRRTGVLEVTCFGLETAGEEGWRPPRLRTLGADT